MGVEKTSFIVFKFVKGKQNILPRSKIVKKIIQNCGCREQNLGWAWRTKLVV